MACCAAKIRLHKNKRLSYLGHIVASQEESGAGRLRGKGPCVAVFKEGRGSVVAMLAVHCAVTDGRPKRARIRSKGVGVELCLCY